MTNDDKLVSRKIGGGHVFTRRRQEGSNDYGLGIGGGGNRTRVQRTRPKEPTCLVSVLSLGRGNTRRQVFSHPSLFRFRHPL